MRQSLKQPPFPPAGYQSPGSPMHDHPQDFVLGDRWTKRLRWLGTLSFLALLALATGSAHLRRQNTIGEPPQRVQSVLEYLGVAHPGHVRWAHAVNTRARLQEALRNRSLHALQADVQHVHGMEVMAGEVSERSDLTFTSFLEQIMSSHARKLVKLAFKDPSSVVPVLKQLQLYAEFGNIEQPFILHADILPSPGGPPVAFKLADFLHLCNIMYPRGILSVGWSTASCAEAAAAQKKGGHRVAPYHSRVISQMLELLTDIGWTGDVTFATRACFLEPSYDALKKLLAEHSGYTLTLWNDEALTNRELQFIRTNLTASDVFVELSDKSGKPIMVYETQPEPLQMASPS